MGMMSLSEIMDRSVDILRKYIKSIILFTLGYGVIIFIGILVIAIPGGIFAVFAAGALKNIPLMVVVMSLLALVIVSLYLSYQVGIMKIASQEFTNEKIDTYKAIGASLRSLLKIMGIVLIFALMLIPVLGLITIILAALGVGLGSAFFNNLESLNGAAAVIVLLVTVLATYFALLSYYTWISLTLPALAIEKKGVFGAIKRSFKLVRKNYWRIMGCLILFYMAIYAINTSFLGLVALLMSIIFLILKLLSIQPDYIAFITTSVSYIQWPLNIISWLIISPMGNAMLTMLYFNQRIKKEGYDLVVRLKAIEKNDERKQESEAAEPIDPTEN